MPKILIATGSGEVVDIIDLYDYDGFNYKVREIRDLAMEIKIALDRALERERKANMVH